MSDKYYKKTVFECKNCGKRWDTPGAAELCYKKDEIVTLTEEIENHKTFALSEIIEELEEKADDGAFDYE